MRTTPSRSALCAVPALGPGLMLLLLVLGGCFETTLHLGLAADAAVDVKFVGDWTFTNKEQDGRETRSVLVVRNFDGKQYYAEWTDEGGKPQRMRGHLAPVKSATFIELTGIADDGSLPDKHLIIRLELEGDTLTLRHLNDKFFEGVSTDAALRAKVEANLDNAEMYAGKSTGTRTRP